MKHWAAKYIGLPYAIGGRELNGLDCWGLLRVIYRNEKGIDLPELPGITAEGVSTISREILDQTQANWTEVARPADGDAVAMSQKTVLHHVGIWAEADGGKIIHCWKCPVIAESLKMLRLRGIRVVRFFRYGVHHRNTQPI